MNYLTSPEPVFVNVLRIDSARLGINSDSVFVNVYGIDSARRGIDPWAS
jgi:hypothetical protein